MYKFEKLLVWQKAMSAAEMVYDLQPKVPRREQYGLMSQLQRAIISVPLNIAEGSANNSDREFYRYLKIARGSLYESVTGLLLVARIYQVNVAEALEVCNNTGRLLNGLMKSLKAAG